VFVVLGPSDREAGRLPGGPSRRRSVRASLVPVAWRRGTCAARSSTTRRPGRVWLSRRADRCCVGAPR